MALQGEYATPVPGWQADQLKVIDETGDTGSVHVLDRPVVVFTVRGAKSGLLRRPPLMRVEHDGCYAAVASSGGAPQHPQWYHSMVANPEVDIQDGTLVHEGLTTRVLQGEEREVWWQRCVDAYPPYAEYQEKADSTTGRQIPVFLAEPAR